MIRVALTSAQHEELRARTREPGLAPRTRDRLEMVRLADAGWTVPRIARHLGAHEQTVRKHVKAFLAHGFAALTDLTITYLVDSYYNPADELGVAWDDPAVDADWGVTDPVLSARDRANPSRAELPLDRRPHHALRP